jgi:hypothetical protein
MKSKQENESIVIHALKGADKDKAYLSASYGGMHLHEIASDKADTFMDGPHTHIVEEDSTSEGVYLYFPSDGSHRHMFNASNGKITPEKEHTHKVYVEQSGDGKSSYYAIESGPSIGFHTHEMDCLEMDYESLDEVMAAQAGRIVYTSRSGSHAHIISLKDGTQIKTVMPIDIMKKMDVQDMEDMEEMMVKKNKKIEEAGTGNIDGGPLSTPDICVSFKRYVYQKAGDSPGVPSNVDGTPGLVPQDETFPAPTLNEGGDGISQDDVLVHTNWCALFEEDCPVLGGCATHPDCLRLVLDRTTKDVVTNYLEKINENRTRLAASLLNTIEKVKGGK